MTDLRFCDCFSYSVACHRKVFGNNVRTGFHPGGKGGGPPNTIASPPKRRKERGEEREGEREIWSLREAILFVGELEKGENNRGKREKEHDMLHV